MIVNISYLSCCQESHNLYGCCKVHHSMCSLQCVRGMFQPVHAWAYTIKCLKDLVFQSTLGLLGNRSSEVAKQLSRWVCGRQRAWMGVFLFFCFRG
jgi:hypothetical protein